MYVILLIALISVCTLRPTGVQSSEDYTDCKLTNLGTEYSGKIDTTSFGNVCEYWTRAVFENNGIEKGKFRDYVYPDGLMKLAENFCRNPNGDKNGPWCFVFQGDGKTESCDIPFCQSGSGGCRKTGTGEEFIGDLSQSAFGNDCQGWKFESLKGTNVCANPTGLLSGPWCFVMNWNTKSMEKEPCYVPICEFPTCSSVVLDSQYSHFVMLNGRDKLTFRFKAWDPSLLNMPYGVKILLSSIPHMHGNKGFELEIKPAHLGGGLTLRRWPPSNDNDDKKDEDHWEKHHSKLGISGSRWSEIWIDWDETKISVGANDEDSLISLDIHEERLRFYSVSGLMSLWQASSCCEIHVTSTMEFTRVWEIPKGEHAFELEFSSRAFNSLAMQLHFSPVASGWGHYEIVLDAFLQDKIFWNKGKLRQQKVIHNKEFPIFEDFWTWQHFTLRIFGAELSLDWENSNLSNKTILKLNEPNIIGLRWFSIGSNGTLAHWMMSCRPQDDAVTPLESCKDDSVGFEYRGLQSASLLGHPCLPWTHPKVDEAYQDPMFFPEGSLEDVANYCRNPNQRQDGPWCFTTQPGFPPKSCSIRDCHFQSCKSAGTGNDFMGSLNTTIGQKSCQKWTDMYPHVLLEPENFPEGSVDDALNYCRNPSRAIIGSYCFTTDPDVRVDACQVPSCHKDIMDSRTIIVRGEANFKRSVFMTPSWRSDKLKFHVKQWDPHFPDGIIIFIRPFKGETHFKLTIGADKNLGVKLVHVSPDSGEVLLYYKNVTHIISVGEWTSFSLHVDMESLELGFISHTYPFLDWTSGTNGINSFSPVYLDFATESGGPMGLNFPSDDCFTFHDDVGEGHSFYEIGNYAHMFFHTNQWLSNPQLMKHKKLDLYLRGLEESEFAIAFSTLGDFEKGYDLIRFTRHTIEYGLVTVEGEMQSFFKQNYDVGVIPIFHFRRFIIHYSEFELTIRTEDPLISFKWTHIHGKRILWYLFTTAAKGNVMWTVNCQPQDVDRVRDGEWSQWGDWTCSVPCGGGLGFRKRTCTAPEPTILGEFCEGESKISGVCNDFPCGQISYATKRKIRVFFNSVEYSFTRRKGESLNFTCNPPYLSSVFQELYFEDVAASMMWTTKGMFFKSANRSDFHVENLKYGDSGLYSLAVMRLNDPSSLANACFFTLAVLNEIIIYENEEYALDDNIGELSLLYQTLVVKWVKENTIVKRFTLNPSIEKHDITIESASDEHSGEWKCIVTQPDLGLVWTTAWYHIKVLPPKTLGAYLAEDSFLSILFKPIANTFSDSAVVPVFVLMSISLAILLLLAVRYYLRCQRRRSTQR